MTAFGTAVLPDVEFGSVPVWRQMLRGASQCAFQANELTGLCLLLAATVFNWKMGLAMAISVILATLTVRLIKGIPDLVDLGLYGFNSALMGLALGNFYQHNTQFWIAVVVMAVVVAAVTVLLSKVLPFPFLAAPFIVSFWIFWLIDEALGMDRVVLGAFPDAPNAYVGAVLASVGSTLFAAAILPGIIALVGIAISSWRHAVVALIGAVVAVAMAAHVDVPGVAINSGFVGFNAVLAAIATYALVKPDLRLAILAPMGATFIFSYINRNAPFPALASGFVLIVWFLLFLGWLNPRFNGETADNAA